MKLSIIMPVYNQEDLVLRALKSIPLNTDDIEIILINDGSTDNTLEIAKRWIYRQLFRDNGNLDADARLSLPNKTNFE